MRKADVEIGMEVRIVDKPRNYKDDTGWIPEMNKYRGKKAVVKGRRLSGFTLSVDEETWSWDARWFNQI